MENKIRAFLSLVSGGLWERGVYLKGFGELSFEDIYQLATEQSVLGLVTAGLEHVKDVKVPQTDILTFIGSSLQIEQCNLSMNRFIEKLMIRFRARDIYSILVKGQGVAQCYEKPLWRSSGDIDLLMSEDSLSKALSFLEALVKEVEKDQFGFIHYSMTIDGWGLELHGTLRGGLGRKIDNVIDEVQADTMNLGSVRAWMNGEIDVYLPAPNNDVVFIFTHILQHFFRGGIGLRQICDWCRLLWTYRDSIDRSLLERRLKAMQLMSEWQAFAALAVDWLGMPVEAMPLYSGEKKWSEKALKIIAFIMETGNFGQNRDASYYSKYPRLVSKAISLWQKTKDGVRQMMIFPKDALRTWILRFGVGVRIAINGR